MTGVVEFLTMRLNEDEAAAVRAARPEPWVRPQPSRPDWYVQFWADQQDRAAVIADPESSAYPIVTTLEYDGDDKVDEELAEGRIEHIARHDPARVLAEVAAKRQHLVMYHENRQRMHALLDAMHASNDEQELVRLNQDWREQCGVQGAIEEVLRLDAAPYADRPGYKEEWRS